MKEFFSSFFSSANIIVRAKALIINAFALTGRFAVFNPYTQALPWAMCFLGFQPVELSFDFTLLLVQGMTRMRECYTFLGELAS